MLVDIIYKCKDSHRSVVDSQAIGYTTSKKEIAKIIKRLIKNMNIFIKK